MCWLKRLSALKEAFPLSLFVQIKGIQLLPTSTVPEAARVRPSLGAQQGRFLRQGGASAQSLLFWHGAHKHEIHDKEQAKALCKAVMKHTKKGNPSVAYTSIKKQTALIKSISSCI